MIHRAIDAEQLHSRSITQFLYLAQIPVVDGMPRVGAVRHLLAMQRRRLFSAQTLLFRIYCCPVKLKTAQFVAPKPSKYGLRGVFLQK